MATNESVIVIKICFVQSCSQLFKYLNNSIFKSYIHCIHLHLPSVFSIFSFFLKFHNQRCNFMPYIDCRICPMNFSHITEYSIIKAYDVVSFTLGQWLALLLHSMTVLGSNPLASNQLWGVCTFCLCILLWCSSFIPPSKN